MFRFNKLAAVAAAVVVCFGFSAGEAQAMYSCSDPTYGVGTGTYSKCEGNNTANQSSSVATSQAVLRTASTQAAGLVASRIAAATGGGGFAVASNGFSASSGISAGDMQGKAAVWVSGSWTSSEDDNVATAFEGDIYTVMTGVDYQASDDVLVGLAVGYENLDIDTAFNGFGGTDGSLEGDGFSVAPYIAVTLSEYLTANLIAGYANIDYDTVRFDPITGNRITGSTDADRYFVNASVGGTHALDGNWRVSGKGAVFYATEDKDAFTETESTGALIAVGSDDSHLGQLLADAKVSYAMDQVEPYALVGLEYDFSKSDAPVAVGQTESLDDDFGAKLGGGINLMLAPNITGGIEAYTVEFRDDYNEYVVNGGLRVKF